MMRELFLQDLSLWNCLWQSTAFLSLGLVAGRLLRRRPSRAYEALLFGMAAAALVPFLSAVVRHCDLGAFPAEPDGSGHVLLYPHPPGARGAADASPEIDAPPPITERGPGPSSSTIASIPWRTILLYAWLTATLILLARLVVTFMYGARLVRHAQSPGCEGIQQAAEHTASRLRLANALQVRASERIHSPVIWCWTRPPVLLVPRALECRDIDWTGVVAHELAHCRRWDHVTGLLTELVASLLPWNPLMWLSRRSLIRLGEQACDDWVVATGQPSEDYAESLLRFRAQRQMAFWPAVVSSKTGLAHRVRRILNDACGNPRAGVRWALALCIAAICISIGVAFAQTRPVPPEAPTAQDGKPTRSLVEAVIEGDTKQAGLLLAGGADINAQVYQRQPLLHHAVARGDKSMVQLLLSKGANIEATGEPDRKTPLHIAAGNDRAGIASLLLTAGADINARNNQGWTPLHLAAAADAKNVTELLISKGAGINARNDIGRTPLHYAADRGRPEIAELLIAKGADIDAKDNEGHTPLYLAMHGDRRERGDCKAVVQLLAPKGTGVSAAHLAAYLGDMAKMKEAIERGLSIDSRDESGFTLLHAAAKGGQTETVKFLLAGGADVNAKADDGGTPLHLTAEEGNPDVAKVLIAKGADLKAKDNRGSTPLHVSATYDRKDVAEVLIANGADIEMADKHGWRPLHAAAWGSARGASTCKAVAELLIAKGADVNAQDNDFGPPLHASVVLNNKDVTELLIANGADVNMGGAGSYAPYTPLYWAVTNGCPEIAPLLVEKGADVNAQVHGDTPLHAAVQLALWETVELLLSHGADVNARDDRGRTPLQLANECGYPKIAALLRQHGAQE